MGVVQLRLSADTDRAERRLCSGREERRSAGDVPERSLHRAELARGPAGDERAGRARQGRAAARAADHRQAVRRAGRAQRRARDRGARRLYGAAGDVVVTGPAETHYQRRARERLEAEAELGAGVEPSVNETHATPRL